MTAEAWITGFVGIAASVDDLARRRISNWIPACACVSGLVLQVAARGWHGLVSALLGIAVGASVFLIFYLAGGMGGGDVKLMAGFGAILGVPRLLEASLWTAGCGGLIALLMIAASSLRSLYRKQYPNRAWATRKSGSEAPTSASAGCIPYAPAIAAGVWLSLVAKT